jgi:ferredoxin-NADP reductase
MNALLRQSKLLGGHQRALKVLKAAASANTSAGSRWMSSAASAIPQTEEAAAHGNSEAEGGIAGQENPLWGATIVDVKDVFGGRDDGSSAVRMLRLQVSQRPKQGSGDALKYLGGQWVDMFIPGIKQIGGYTITSAQNLPTAVAYAVQAPQRGDELELVVRQARHPPAAWVHSTECRAGSEVDIRVGGVFTLSSCRVLVPEKELARPEAATSDSSSSCSSSFNGSTRFICSNVILVGGGVGLNPLYSMLLEIAAAAASGVDGVPSVDVVYSVKTVEDAVMLWRLEALLKGPLKERMRLIVCLTGEKQHSFDGDDSGRESARLVQGRADVSLLEELTKGRSRDDTVALVCGPKGMAEDVKEMLVKVGVAPDAVHFESWW